ncbi:MAG: hypothetical protein VW169_00955 [Rhodospirillaceae bacterium]
MLVAGFLAAIAAATSSDRIYPNPAQWNWEWPKTDRGLTDEVHDVTFAFVFQAFRPKGTLHHTK